MIILCTHKIMQELVTCSQSHSSVDVMKVRDIIIYLGLNIVNNMDFRRLNDTEIENLIELWR